MIKTTKYVRFEPKMTPEKQVEFGRKIIEILKLDFELLMQCRNFILFFWKRFDHFSNLDIIPCKACMDNAFMGPITRVL